MRDIKELLPIVAELSGRYTGNESTSIPYEKAEQLMGAVIYCIHEIDREQEALSVKMPARAAYEAGYHTDTGLSGSL